MDQAETLRKLMTGRAETRVPVSVVAISYLGEKNYEESWLHSTFQDFFIARQMELRWVSQKDLQERTLQQITEENSDVDTLFYSAHPLQSRRSLSLYQNFVYPLILMGRLPQEIEKASRLIRLLARTKRIRHFGVLVNQVTEVSETYRIFNELVQDVKQFVDVHVELAGSFLVKSKEDGKWLVEPSFSFLGNPRSKEMKPARSRKTGLIRRLLSEVAK